jgi:predicted DNA-binding antitoxin AbrB/MazE fold protein
MTKILEATYSNGHLVLSESLDPELEGKKLKVMILKTDEESQTEDAEADRRAKVKRFLEHAKKHSFELPPDYRFNRDELYDR